MSAEGQSPSAAYVPTQINERAVIRSEERTSADLRIRSSGVSNGREPAVPARPTAVLAHSRKLMRTTLRTNRHGVFLRAHAPATSTSDVLPRPVCQERWTSARCSPTWRKPMAWITPASMRAPLARVRAALPHGQGREDLGGVREEDHVSFAAVKGEAGARNGRLMQLSLDRLLAQEQLRGELGIRLATAREPVFGSAYRGCLCRTLYDRFLLAWVRGVREENASFAGSPRKGSPAQTGRAANDRIWRALVPKMTTQYASLQ